MRLAISVQIDQFQCPVKELDSSWNEPLSENAISNSIPVAESLSSTVAQTSVAHSAMRMDQQPYPSEMLRAPGECMVQSWTRVSLQSLQAICSTEKMFTCTLRQPMTSQRHRSTQKRAKFGKPFSQTGSPWKHAVISNCCILLLCYMPDRTIVIYYCYILLLLWAYYCFACVNLNDSTCICPGHRGHSAQIKASLST